MSNSNNNNWFDSLLLIAAGAGIAFAGMGLYIRLYLNPIIVEANQNADRLQEQLKSQTIAESQALNNAMKIAGITPPSATCHTAIRVALHMVANREVTPEEANKWLEQATEPVCGITENTTN